MLLWPKNLATTLVGYVVSDVSEKNAFETSGTNYPTTERHIPDDVDPQLHSCEPVAYPGILFEGGFNKFQLRTEDRENGDLGSVIP